MKKVLLLILSLLLCFSLIACGNQDEGDTETPDYPSFETDIAPVPDI